MIAIVNSKGVQYELLPSRSEPADEIAVPHTTCVHDFGNGARSIVSRSLDLKAAVLEERWNIPSPSNSEYPSAMGGRSRYP
jgi:hypothetical protein